MTAKSFISLRSALPDSNSTTEFMIDSEMQGNKIQILVKIFFLGISSCLIKTLLNVSFTKICTGYWLNCYKTA